MGSHTNSNSISTQNTTSINHQNSQLFSTSSSRTSNHYPTNEELDFMLYLELLKRKEQREIETLKEWNKTVPWKQKNKNLTKKQKNLKMTLKILINPIKNFNIKREKTKQLKIKIS